MLVSVKSIFSGEVNTLDLDVTQAQIDSWKGGMLIQDAMPHLNADEREFLMTGAVGTEFEDNTFDEDDYEYDGQPDEAQEWFDFDPDC